MTAMQAAIRLGIEVDYLYRLLRQGIVKGKKKGRGWVVDTKSVEERMRRVA